MQLYVPVSFRFTKASLLTLVSPSLLTDNQSVFLFTYYLRLLYILSCNHKG